MKHLCDGCPARLIALAFKTNLTHGCDFQPVLIKRRLSKSRDVGIILGGPYNSGILATGAVQGAKYNYAEASPEIRERVQRIEAVCDAHKVPIAAAALQFVLGHPAVKSVIPGARSAIEVDANVRLFHQHIPEGLWQDLKGEHLIRAEAPVPTN